MRLRTQPRDTRKKCNFLEWYEILSEYALAHGVSFNEYGYPVLPISSYFSELPGDIDIVPIAQRSKVMTPSRTLLCTFENDQRIYAHVRAIIKAIQKGDWAVERLLEGYRRFYGIVGFDLSVCINAPIEKQRFYLLLNQLLNAFFAVNGVRILANIRIGDCQSIDALHSLPRNIVYCCGYLGCHDNFYRAESVRSMILRLFLLLPHRIVIYGRINHGERKLFNDLGVSLQVVSDYTSRMWKFNKEVG